MEGVSVIVGVGVMVAVGVRVLVGMWVAVGTGVLVAVLVGTGVLVGVKGAPLPQLTSASISAADIHKNSRRVKKGLRE